VAITVLPGRGPDTVVLVVAAAATRVAPWMCIIGMMGPWAQPLRQLCGQITAIMEA